MGTSKRKHQALFPFLNQVQFHETVSTDTFFLSIHNISGATCAQVFYGLASHYINVYGLRTESDNVHALEDFVREEGIPSIIRSDNAHSEQLSKSWLKRLREWVTRSEFTEPGHSQQNPLESQAICWLKHNIAVIRKRTGTSKDVWLYVAKYVAGLHNICADETLGW